MAFLVDKIFLLFFLIYSVLLICFLGPFFLPKEFVHQSMNDMLKMFMDYFKDPLVLENPAWVRFYIYSDAFLSLPFSLVAIFAFAKGGCKWFRTPSIVYGTYAASAMIPCISYFWNETLNMPTEQFYRIFGLYVGFFFFFAFYLLYFLKNSNYGVQPVVVQSKKAKRN